MIVKTSPRRQRSSRKQVFSESWNLKSRKSLTGIVATIAELAAAAGFTGPTTIVVGKVVRLAEQLDWF
jgi:siroheme synthase